MFTLASFHDQTEVCWRVRPCMLVIRRQWSFDGRHHLGTKWKGWYLLGAKSGITLCVLPLLGIGTLSQYPICPCFAWGVLYKVLLGKTYVQSRVTSLRAKWKWTKYCFVQFTPFSTSENPSQPKLGCIHQHASLDQTLGKKSGQKAR